MRWNSSNLGKVCLFLLAAFPAFAPACYDTKEICETATSEPCFRFEEGCGCDLWMPASAGPNLTECAAIPSPTPSDVCCPSVVDAIVDVERILLILGGTFLAILLLNVLFRYHR